MNESQTFEQDDGAEMDGDDQDEPAKSKNLGLDGPRACCPIVAYFGRRREAVPVLNNVIDHPKYP